MRMFSPRNLSRLLLSGVLLWTSAAFAAHPDHPAECDVAGGPPMHGLPFGDGLPPHLRGLKLSEAQRDRIFEFMHAQVPAMRERAKALHKLEDQLRTLALSPDYHETQAKATAEAASTVMSELMLMHVRADRQVFEVLTPEQRKLLADLRLEREGRPGPEYRHRDFASEARP